MEQIRLFDLDYLLEALGQTPHELNFMLERERSCLQCARAVVSNPLERLFTLRWAVPTCFVFG